MEAGQCSGAKEEHDPWAKLGIPFSILSLWRLVGFKKLGFVVISPIWSSSSCLFRFIIVLVAVPLIPGYQEVQISSEDPVVCSQTALSSAEKLAWCEINWDSDRGLATIRNTRFL